MAGTVARQGPAGLIARAVSLAVGGGVTLLLLLAPFLLTRQVTPGAHGALALMMTGAMGCLAHGIGYQGRWLATRLFVAPATAWGLVALGLLLLGGR